MSPAPHCHSGGIRDDLNHNPFRHVWPTESMRRILVGIEVVRPRYAAGAPPRPRLRSTAPTHMAQNAVKQQKHPTDPPLRGSPTQIRTHTIMTATPQYVTEPGLDPLAARAVEHVWMHFTRMFGYADGHVPVIVRGEGSRTRQPRRPSTKTSPSGCCAGSCRRHSSTPASTAVPTTVGIRLCSWPRR